MTSGAAEHCPATPSGLVVARGRFNTTQLETLVREHGGVVEEYKGKRLVKVSDVRTEPITGAGTARSAAGAHHRRSPSSSRASSAIGSEAAIKSAIDAQLTAHSITSNNDMMELVADIDSGNNAWAVGRFDAIADQAQLPAGESPARFPRSRPSRS